MQNSKHVKQRRRQHSDDDQQEETNHSKDYEYAWSQEETKTKGDYQNYTHNTSGNMSNISTTSTADGTRELLFAAKRIISNKHSLSESSAEDISKAQNEMDTDQSRKESTMWRNELSLNPNSKGAQPIRKTIGTSKDCAASAKKQLLSDAIDVVIRILIVTLFIKLEIMQAFKREIHEEELWLYKNPRRPDIVTPLELLLAVIIVPFLVALAFYTITKDKRDFHAANWAWTLALCLNGIPTSMLKITVGRPRPDFYYRCFPDGIMILNNTTDSSSLDFQCTGKLSDINEGRKSFPSGHSSFAFASFGFIAYYVGAKLHAFNKRGRGNTWRLCLAIAPLFVAALVAVSRTCDYHHHWQDVTVGGLIGLVTGYIAYRQYYPGLLSKNCHRPLVRWPQRGLNEYECVDSDVDFDSDAGVCGEGRPLLSETCRKQQSKWY